MGIDFGSTTAKTVILNSNKQIVGSCIKSMGAVSNDGVLASIAGALEEAGLTQADIARVVSTGYGRRMIDIADKNYTEITCHARGAREMMPEAQLVIDIGGQDSKVISIDESGSVVQFAMNDRCAAGTGKFLEVLARAMNIELDDMGPMAMKAQNVLKISSMCATFAESEVISLLAEGHDKADVLGAVHMAVATRIKGLAARVGKKRPIVMTGGVAQNVAAIHFLEKAFECDLLIPENPQVAGAYGAALLAMEDLEKSGVKVTEIDKEDFSLDQKMNEPLACVPQCKGDPDKAGADEKQPVNLVEK
jgi:predicted CoA-substrate-specific enzyme activase